MRSTATLLAIFLLSFCSSIFGQSEFCAQHHAHEKLWAEQPDIKAKHDQLDVQIRTFLKNGNLSHAPAIYTLPVVVHIIHDNGAENIPDAVVLQGIQDLNDAFANVGYYNPATGLDTEIQFCLAKRDPDGNATTGITRDQSPLTEMTLETDDITVKDLNRWDPTQYINIWLVRAVTSSAAGPGVVGYAYFPASHGAPEDGIMMEADWFGSNQGQSSVIVHEMGHYLGVYHTFQGGCGNNDCLADGDQVCDTPPDNSTAAIPCGGSMNSCMTDTDSGFATDQDDMFWNYMDYGDWNCYSAFTQGQTDRMYFSIENPRVSLLGSFACLDPCMSPLTAGFIASSNSLDVGGNVTFINSSVNATSAMWSVDGVVFSNNFNADYTFNQIGTFEICMTVGNVDPNCLDETCQMVQVNCPVAAEFTTDNFYPMPGEVVNYTNTSLNASDFEWQVDGVTQSTSTDFTFSFSTTGTYDVCLVAGNGLCEAEFCLPVFVVDDPIDPGECDTSFLKTYGTPNLLEFGGSLVSAPNGGFFVGGGRGTEALIVHLDEEANLIWAREFNPTSDADDFVYQLKMDSDGDLVGIGQAAEIGGNIEVFAFKYDWQADQMIWLNELDIADPAGEGYYDIVEKAPGDNFYIMGQTTVVGNLDGDALLMEVNRNTGFNVFANTFNFSIPNERFLSGQIFNNSLYVTGRVGSGPTGAPNWNRPGITRFDLNGNQTWTRLYLNDIATGAGGDLLPANIIEDNGLVVFGAGDASNFPAQNSALFLYRTDANGDLEWAKRYDLPGSTSEVAVKAINLPDGYLCMANYSDIVSGDVLIFKTNQSGDVQWSKRFGGTDEESGRDIIFQNSLIYFTGSTSETDPGQDIFLASLNPDGSATAADTCNLFEDIILVESDWATPYDGQHDLGGSSLFANFFTNTETTETVLIESQVVCANPCTQDSCDLVPDAVFQDASVECMGDSLHVTMTVCNIGNVELPVGTSIAFYDDDPTTVGNTLIWTENLPEKIKRDSCLTFDFSMPNAPLPIFGLVNDIGSFPLPIDLVTGMPNTTILECDYTNNLGSFDFNFTPPMLDLGPDIVVCENEVAVLDAGPGFFSYKWQDGDDEQTYTVFFPGTYSVTVTDECGGTQTDEVTITVDPASIVDLGPDTLICEGDTLLITANGFDRFEWFPKNIFPCDSCSTVGISPQADSTQEVIIVASTDLGCYSVDTIEVGTTTPVFTRDTLFFCPGDTVQIFGENVTEAGVYSRSFPRAEGCDSTHTISLEAIANLLLQLPADVTISLRDSIQLNPLTNGTDLTWQWTPSEWLSCDDCENPFSRPFETISYSVLATDENGCEASDDIQLFVRKDRSIYIPNAFSPNGDGINDIFHIYAGGNVENILRFEIFDRWGERVFEDANFQPNDPAHGWDGVFREEMMNPAVFVYYAEVEFIDGDIRLFEGDVHLIR